VKASFKKEFLSYFRTKKFMIITFVILGLSILSPVLITGMGALMDMMSDIYADFGIDIAPLTDELGSTASIGVSSTVSDITGPALIVILILLVNAAGGEQKKRAVIIPQSSGLKSFAYIFPKFIIYPLTVFVLALAGMFVSWAFSAVLFESNDVSLLGIILAGTLTGICLMFYVCFHITLGTATGKPGMSAAVCITVSLLLPNIFAFTISDYMYNPFALNLLAGSLLHYNRLSMTELVDIIITVVFALAIMIIAFYIALFAQNARKIDNSGNEIEL